MADPLPGLSLSDAVDSVAHVVQVALTPVFLLSGIGTLLNVFNARLARVADHTAHIAELLASAPDPERRQIGVHLARLNLRRLVLDATVVLGALGGAATCGAAIVLFLGGLREAAIASWLFALFGLALGCTIVALMAFVADSLLAWHGLHAHGPLPRAKGD